MKSNRTFERAFPLEDLSVRSAAQGGDGRTVDAYCAVYNVPVQVSDWEGEYEEIIRPRAFKRTIGQKKTNFQVFYNHAKDIYGSPSDRYSVPIGTPVEVREDAKGVFTSTRYAETPLGDEILELVKTGAIRGQSFSGTWMNSRVTKAKVPGQLDVVERLEVAMREYGPCPFPVYEAAAMVGVRAEDLAQQLAELSDEDRADLIALLSTGTPLEPASGTSDDAPPNDDTPKPAAADGPSEDQLTVEQERRRRLLAS